MTSKYLMMLVIAGIVGQFEAGASGFTDEMDVGGWHGGVNCDPSGQFLDEPVSSSWPENTDDGYFGLFEMNDFQPNPFDQVLINLVSQNIIYYEGILVVNWQNGVYKSISKNEKKGLEKQFGDLELYFARSIFPCYSYVRAMLGYK